MADKSQNDTASNDPCFCLKQLEKCIEDGDAEEAAKLAQRLARQRVRCTIETRQDGTQKSQRTLSSEDAWQNPENMHQWYIGGNEDDDPYAGGWPCPDCTFVNIRTRPGCEICAATKPGEFASSDDDERTFSRLDDDANNVNNVSNLWEHEKECAKSPGIFDELLKLDDQPVIWTEEDFECPICLQDIECGEGIKLRECLHTFCKKCLVQHVSISEKARVDCPHNDETYACDCTLQDREIKALVPSDVYEKYQQRSMVVAESGNPNSFHCKTANCNGWCVYEDDANEFMCPVCKMINCLVCREIHEEKSCQEYQQWIKDQAIYNEDARRTQMALTDMVLSGDALKCPFCDIVIMKKGGCDWIQCSVCKNEICWVTKGPRWGIGGRGDTSGGCKCRVNGRSCHPNCKNCH